MKAVMFLYTMRDAEPRVITKVNEKLFGKIQMSNHGRYAYEVKGILPEGTYVRPVRAVLIVKEEYRHKVTDLFNTYGVKFRVFEIKVGADIFENKEFF